MSMFVGLTKLRDALRQKEEKGLSIFVELVKMNSECPEIYKTLEKGRQTESPLEVIFNTKKKTISVHNAFICEIK